MVHHLPDFIIFASKNPKLTWKDITITDPQSGKYSNKSLDVVLNTNSNIYFRFQSLTLEHVPEDGFLQVYEFR